MAISQRAAGSWADNNATTQVVTIPASASAGDMMLLLFAVKPYTATPTCNNGWTATGTFFANGTTANGNGTGSVKVGAFYKEHTGSESNPTVTWGTTAAPGAAVIVVFQKGGSDTWDTPVGSGEAAGLTGSTWSGTSWTGYPEVTAGDLVMFHIGIRDDTTMTNPSVTQEGVTFDTLVEFPATALSSVTSNDIAADGFYVLATAGTSTASPAVTETLSTSDATDSSGWMTRLRVTTAGSHRAAPNRRHMLGVG